MSKLLRLKEWVTLPEAARYLAIAFGEDVTESDVLQLAINERLRLSIRFVNKVKAYRGKVIASEFAAKKEMSPKVMAALEEMMQISDKSFKYDKPPVVLCGHQLNGNKVFERDGDCVWIDGIYDLTLLADDAKGIEDRYQLATGGPRVNPTWFPIIVLEDDDGAVFSCHSEDSDGDPCPDPVPDDGVLVVRYRALSNLVQSIACASGNSEKPLATTERNTLLTIIAALCDYSAIKHRERGATSQIARLTEEIGASVSADTVKRVLEKIPDALDARMK